jgi:uncharacterized protein (DUF927 family)
MNTNFYTDYKVTNCIVNAVKNSDTNCTGVTTEGYSETCFVVDMGNSADTLDGSNYIELEVEESDDNSTYTDVANADLVKYVTGNNTGTFGVINAAAEDSTVFMTGYRGEKRYARVVISFTGTHSTGTPMSVLAVQKAMVLPANAVTTQ